MRITSVPVGIVVLFAIVPYASAAAMPMVFPHFAQGDGYQTTFTFNNLSAASTVVTISYFLQNGSIAGSNVISLPPYGSASQSMSGSTLSIGWAKVVTNPPTDVAANETIQRFNSDGTLLAEASVLAAQPDTALHAAVYEKDGIGTGVAVVNIGSAQAAITLSVRDANGGNREAGALKLGPSEQAARFVSEFLSVSSLEGTLDVTSNVPVAVVVLRLHMAGGGFSTVPVYSRQSETFFSPRAGISARIVQEIQKAQSSIDIAMYLFTRTEIATALIAAKNRGVDVRLVADTSESTTTGTAIPRLEAAGISVKLTSGRGGGIMHNKYAIFDGRVLLTGSYNWSTAAENENDENALFIRDQSLVAAYETAFSLLWATR